MIKNYKDLSGFTLIEVLVGLAAFSVAMVAAGGVLFRIYKDCQRQRDYLQCVENTRWAMEFMTNELRTTDAASLNTNPGSLPRGRLIRFTRDPTAQPWWYWRGNSASDAVSFGDNNFLYRGQANDLNNAYNVRRQLANFIVDNPDVINNTTGLPPPDGTADPIFFASGGLITLTLTVRPYPAQNPCNNPTNPVQGNCNYTLRTRVRVRN